jgi:ankyrin repeat protein
LVFTRLLSCENLNALLSRVNKLYQTALHLAIKHNRDTKIFITPLIPLIEERDSLGRTPLHTAVLSPTTSFSTITFLLENGAPVSDDDDTLRTPLHLALALPTPPKSSIISTLVEHDPDVSTIPDKFKKTPLHLAASNGHLSAIRILLDTVEAQSIINTLDTKQHSPLWLAAERGHEKVVETLLDFGATDPYGEALYAAALTGRVGVVKMLMRRAPVGRMRSGLCPLRAAAEMGWREVCEELWRAGVMKRFKRERGRKGKYAGAEHYAEVVLEECKLQRGAK